MEVLFDCTYCGHKWTQILHDKANARFQRCPTCKDSYPVYALQDSTTLDIFGYRYGPQPLWTIKEPKKDEQDLYDEYFRMIN